MLYLRSSVWVVFILVLGTDVYGQSKTYGNRRLGLYFSTQLKLATPFRLPQSYPQQEYWHESGRLWLFNASIPRRHQIDAEKKKNLSQTFFFPDQTASLKKGPAPATLKQNAESVTRLTGTIKIYGNEYYAQVVEVWVKGYVFVVAVFTKPDFKSESDKIIQSLKHNPNFKW